MQANKKYVGSDGIEFFMCPFTEFKVTQGENVGTHLGTRAVDFASGTAGYRAAYYAPATVKCVMTVPSSGQGMWQTVNNVRCPNGYVGKVTFVTVHDDTFNAYVGMVVPQGSQLGNMGTKGYATGVHCHIEFIQAAMNSANWIKNGYGIWTFNGTESYVDDTFYVDDTNIIYGGAGNWRKTGSTGSTNTGNTTNYTVEDEHYAVRYKVDQVRIRKGSPSGDVVGYVNTGDEVEYFAKTAYGGHRWVRDNKDQWYAISNSEERGKEMWVDLIDPSEMKVNQTPTTPTEPTTPSEPEEEWDLEQPDLEPVLLESQHGLTVKQNLVNKDKYIYKCPYVMTPEFVVVHNAGTNGNPSAETLNTSMIGDDEQKSWHLSVDENGAVQGLPLNRNGWHSGDGKEGNGNRKGIAVEICRDMYDDGSGQYKVTGGTSDPRYAKAVDNGALTVAILLNKYNWDISHVTKHQDYMDKYCPHHILNEGWGNFLNQVQAHLDKIQGKSESNEPVEEPSEKPTEPSDEKVNVSLLNKVLEKLNSIFK